MILLVSRIYGVDDRVINECATVGGIIVGRGK
jgi:hypothetical protein